MNAKPLGPWAKYCSKPVSLSNGYFLMHSDSVDGNHAFQLYSTKTNQWTEIIDSCPANYHKSFFGLLDSKHIYVVRMQRSHKSYEILIYALDFEAPKLLTCTRRIPFVKEEIVTVYYVQKAFHFLCWSESHMILRDINNSDKGLNEDSKQIFFDNHGNAMELMVHKTSENFTEHVDFWNSGASSLSQIMVFFVTNVVYFWKNGEWTKINQQIEMNLNEPILVECTADGKYALIMGGRQYAASFNKKIFVVDLVHSNVYTSMVQLPDFKIGTKCVLVANFQRDILLTFGYIRLYSMMYPEDLVYCISSYVGTEYLHVMDTYGTHKKVHIDTVLSANK